MKTWNVCDEDHDYKDLQNRIYNGLKRHNRVMNDIFPIPHPFLLQFVTILEEEAKYQVQTLKDIRYRKVK